MKTKFTLSEQNFSKGPIHHSLNLAEEFNKNNPLDSHSQTVMDEWCFSPEEWKKVKQQKIRHLDPFYSSDIKFTSIEIEGLQIISQIEKEKRLPSEKEKMILRKFFAYIAGNRSFNQRISRLIQAQPKSFEHWKFGLNSLSFLREFSFKAKKFNELFELSEKIKLISLCVQEGKEDELLDKLNLYDFHLADSFINMEFAINWIDKLGIWNSNSMFCRVKKCVKEIENGIKRIDDRFDKEQNYLTGDIVFDTMNKSRSYDNKKFDLFNKIDLIFYFQEKIFRHKFVHSAIGIKREDGYAMAEIDLKYQDPVTSFSRLCIAEVYRLNLQRLITRERLSKCLDALKHHPNLNYIDSEEKLLNYIEEQYRLIIQDFFSNPEKFEKINNDQSRQINTIITPHTKSVPTSPVEINFESEQKMICSEFIGKSIFYCIDRLNKNINDEVFESLENNELCDTESSIVKVYEEIIKNPFSECENFSSMHVDRLFLILSPYITLVGPPEFISKIVEI